MATTAAFILLFACSCLLVLSTAAPGPYYYPEAREQQEPGLCFFEPYCQGKGAPTTLEKCCFKFYGVSYFDFSIGRCIACHGPHRDAEAREQQEPAIFGDH